MTQVKEWSNPELNRKLAELMGYTVIDFSYADDPDNYDYFKVVNESGEQVGEDRESEEEAWDEVPNYSGSVAASLEVQTAAIKVSTRYVDTLVEVMKPENMAYSRACVAELLNASPRERAEAAYITLQGAKRHEGNGETPISADDKR